MMMVTETHYPKVESQKSIKEYVFKCKLDTVNTHLYIRKTNRIYTKPNVYQLSKLTNFFAVFNDSGNYLSPINKNTCFSSLVKQFESELLLGQYTVNRNYNLNTVLDTGFVKTNQAITKPSKYKIVYFYSLMSNKVNRGYFTLMDSLRNNKSISAEYYLLNVDLLSDFYQGKYLGKKVKEIKVSVEK